MDKFFAILFWFTVAVGSLALFLNTGIGDETVRRIAHYIHVEPDRGTSSTVVEDRRRVEDRVRQLNELSVLRAKLLHDRLALLRQSEEIRRDLSDRAMTILKEYPTNIPDTKGKIEGLKDAVIALNGRGSGIKEADDVLQKVRDLEKNLLGTSTSLSQVPYEQHAAEVAHMEQLADRFKSTMSELAFQKGMLDSVASKARDSSEKLRNLNQQLAAKEQTTVSMAQRMASQSAAMQDRMAAQMDRLASMQERASLQMERAYAQQERMFDRMQMMSERMQTQSSRLESTLERSAAQYERLQSMQERTSSTQERNSNLGSH
jgi:hypothetical protein